MSSKGRLQPLVLHRHDENKLEVEENVDIDGLPSLSPSLSPKSGYDEETDDATSQKQPKPDQKTVVLISHAYQTDTEAGDYFGATLYTYTRPSGKKYKYQHLLKDIKEGYPAQKMRNREGDELVLIDQTFAPDLDHTEVLNRFHHDVKVDGKTRFCLVLRKSEKKQSSWTWYETSAILCPDPNQHHHNEVPIVKEAKYGPAAARRFTQKSYFPLSTLRFTCSLTNPAFTAYLLKGMTSANEAMCTWFECEVTGTDNIFHVDDFFLSYDKVDKTFVMSKNKGGRNCVIFQDVRRVPGSDHPDGACACELANMDAEEITPYFRSSSDSGYASAVGSQEKGRVMMPTQQVPSFLSKDNLDIDSSVM